MAICSATLLGILVHIVLNVTVLGLRCANRFINRAFHLLRGAANCFACDFLNLASNFLGLLRISPANGRHVCLEHTMLLSANLMAVGSRSVAMSEFGAMPL